jgi:pyruvate dehydrogenase E2 component (dihydrolipoamide acetyltransferase)
MMYLSLTFDHRVVDGAPASEFLQRLSTYVQCPALLLKEEGQ